jgi:hypothetical protein
MLNPTSFLPGLSHALAGRQRRSHLDQLRGNPSSLRQLCEISGPWLPTTKLSPTANRVNSRQRTYPLPLPFHARHRRQPAGLAATGQTYYLGQLYFRRWAVELFFREATLGLDVLRCQTPAMVRKEIVMHALACNLIRALMQDIAHSYQVSVQRLSFKGTVDALRQWRELFENTKAQPRAAGKLRLLFHQSIANDLLPHAIASSHKNHRRMPLSKRHSGQSSFLPFSVLRGQRDWRSGKVMSTFA